jgi:hypothetical protein
MHRITLAGHFYFANRTPHNTRSNVTDKKKTLYELLEVSPSASLPEIQAAHKRLSRQLVSGKYDLSREDIEFELKVIDVALQTLSNQASRDAYDAQFATPVTTEMTVVPLNANALSIRADDKSLKLAAALEDSHNMTTAILNSHESPLKIVSTTIDSSVMSLKKILKVIAGMMVLGVVIKGGAMILAGNQAGHPPGGISKADEKVILQEYYQVHGIRPGSKAEADLLEVENRRKENEQRAAELEKKKHEEEYRQFVEESRRIGDQVSADLKRAEENARYEEAQKKRQQEQEQRQQEEADRDAERIRVQEARQRLGLDTPSQ